jgi:hypothetical protein
MYVTPLAESEIWVHTLGSCLIPQVPSMGQGEAALFAGIMRVRVTSQ